VSAHLTFTRLPAGRVGQRDFRASGGERQGASAARGPWVKGNDSGGQHRRPAVGPSHRAIASSAGAEGAGADPRRNGDDYPM